MPNRGWVSLQHCYRGKDSIQYLGRFSPCLIARASLSRSLKREIYPRSEFKLMPAESFRSPFILYCFISTESWMDADSVGYGIVYRG